MRYYSKASTIRAVLLSFLIATPLLCNNTPEPTIWQFVRTIIGSDPSKPATLQNDVEFNKIITRYDKNHDSDYLKKNLINTIIPEKRLGSEQDEEFYGKTPLIAAIMVGNEHAFNVLLAKDADVSMPDADGLTPLYYAATNKKLYKVLDETSATIKYARMITKLVSNGAKVTERDHKTLNNVLHAALLAETPLIFTLLEDEIPYQAFLQINRNRFTVPELLDHMYGSAQAKDIKKVFNRALKSAKARAGILD